MNTRALTPSQVEAQVRVRRALEHIQRAQDELGRAGSELASIVGGAATQAVVMRAYDLVHRTWYRVAKLRDRAAKLDLDEMAKESFARRQADGEAAR